jgi:hypothetical protein
LRVFLGVFETFKTHQLHIRLLCRAKNRYAKFGVVLACHYGEPQSNLRLVAGLGWPWVSVSILTTSVVLQAPWGLQLLLMLLAHRSNSAG